MRRPAIEDIETACEWLEINDGDDDEDGRCHRVASWLRAYTKKAEEDAVVHKIAREAGCSAKIARAALAKQRFTA